MTALHPYRNSGRPAHAALLLLALLLAITGAPAPVQALDEAPTREEAREEIDSLIEAGEWRKAKKAVKSFKKEHCSTDEEMAEADTLESLVKGSEELSKIETAYRKKGKPRKTARSLASETDPPPRIYDDPSDPTRTEG